MQPAKKTAAELVEAKASVSLTFKDVKEIMKLKTPLIVTLLALLVIGLTATRPARAAVVCATTPWNVTNTTDLNAAITCYNNSTVASIINITNNFILNAATVPINNANTGATLTINGDGKTIDGNDSQRHFTIIANNPKVIIDNITLTNGKAVNDCGGGSIVVECGGAIKINNGADVTVNNSTLSSNTASSSSSSGGANYIYLGGGIYSDGGVLTVSNSTLSKNTADDDGGGIYSRSGDVTVSNSTLSDNTADAGGGIWAQSNDSFLVSNSTFSGNMADTGGGILSVSNTGRIHNSTFSDNTATSIGGGILSSASRMPISNSTFSSNTASDSYTFKGEVVNGGGGIFWDKFNDGDMENTIFVKGMTGGNCFIETADPANTAVQSLADDDTCTGASLSQTINLDPLADNGCVETHATTSPTAQACVQTHALGAGSAAIDAGDADICSDASTINNLDQRGVSRVVSQAGDQCDIGAYEFINEDPAMHLSFDTGAQGSDFEGGCTTYPANSTVTVSLTFPNGVTVPMGTKETDADGVCATFILDTSDDCPLGTYIVTATAGDVSITTPFTIATTEPLRSLEAITDMAIIDPSGAGGGYRVFIPIIQ